MQRRLVAVLAPTFLLGSLALLGGCGSEDRTTVVPSEAAKKLDAGVQKGMMEYMKTKGAGKRTAKKRPPPWSMGRS